MKIGKLIACGLVAALLTACGESVEHKMQQAQIALNSGRPDAALSYARQVLEERPDDAAALMLMAKAHLRLRQFEESKKLLEKIAANSPEAVEPRQELLNLALAAMSDLIGASEFTTNDTLVNKFTDAKELGHLQADWFNAVAKDPATADFARARLIILDAMRIEKFMKEEETRIRGESGLIDSSAPVTSATIEEQRRQIRNMHASAETNLESCLRANPNLYAAAGAYARLLRKREAWSEIWVLADKTDKYKDIPASLAADLVDAVLNIPERLHTEASRVKVARNILDSVSEVGRKSIDWKIMRSRLYLREQDKDKALVLAEEAFRLQPKDSEVKLTYAWCLFEHGKFPMAKTLLQSLAIELRDNEQVQLLYGLTLIKTGDAILAAEALRRTTDINPQNQVARGALVQLLAAEQGNMAIVIEDINKLYQSKPTDPDAIRYKFSAEVASNSPNGVRTLLRSVETITPRLAGHLRVLVDGSIFLNDSAKALLYAEELTRVSADQVDSYLLLARVHLMRKAPEEARRVLLSVREKFPDSPDMNETLAQLYLSQGSYDRAIEISNKMLESRPDNINARLILAQAFGQLAMAEEALDQVKEVLDRVPNDPRALEIGASIHRLTGQQDLAKAYIEKIDESRVDETKYPGLLAQLKLQKGDVGEALAICNRAIAAGSTDPRVRLTLANLHSQSKNSGEQEVHLTAFVRENPSNYQGFQSLARFYAVTNTERGISQFQALRSVNESMARLAESALYRSQGRHEDAVRVLSEYYPRLLERRDVSAWTFARHLAAAMVHRDRNAIKANAVFDALVERNINAARAMLTQLELSWGVLDDNARIAKLKQVEMKLGMDDVQAITLTAARYGQIKRMDLASALVNQWCEKHPDSATLCRLQADTYAAMGLHSQAIEACRRALKLEPDSPGRYARLAEAQVVAGLYPDAEQTYDDMAKIDAGARIIALWAKANMYQSVGLDRQAIPTLRLLDEPGKATDPRVSLALGHGLMSTGEMIEARQVLMRVPGFARQFPEAQVLLVQIEKEMGLLDDAKKRLETVAMNAKTRPYAVEELIRLSVQTRKFDQLMQWSDQVLALSDIPTHLKAQWLAIRITVQSSTRDWKAVESTLAQMLVINPQSVELQASRAAVLLKLKEQDQIKAMLKGDAGTLAQSPMGGLLAVASGLAPSAASVQNVALVGYMDHLARGDNAAALNIAKSLYSPGNTIYRSDLVSMAAKASTPAQQQAARITAAAILAMQSNLSPLAEDFARDAIAADASFVPAYGVLLSVHTAQGKEVKLLEKLFADSIPDSTVKLYMDSLLLSSAKDYPGAIAKTEELLSREPDNFASQYRKVGMLKASGATTQVIKLLDQLLKVAGPNEQIIANDLAYRLALYAPDRLDEAKGLAGKVMQAYPQWAPVRDTLGWIQHLSGDNQAALKNLLVAVNVLRNEKQIHYHLGVVYLGLGNTKWGKYHLEASVAGAQAETELHYKDATARLAGINTQ